MLMLKGVISGSDLHFWLVRGRFAVDISYLMLCRQLSRQAISFIVFRCLVMMAQFVVLTQGWKQAHLRPKKGTKGVNVCCFWLKCFGEFTNLSGAFFYKCPNSITLLHIFIPAVVKIKSLFMRLASACFNTDLYFFVFPATWTVRTGMCSEWKNEKGEIKKSSREEERPFQRIPLSFLNPIKW